MEQLTDRELLKLAAKAAGEITPHWYDNENYCDGFLSKWNPLADDGDALRLAVQLGIDLLFTSEDVEAVATQHTRQEDQELISPWALERLTLASKSPDAATRRAIVRAAAEIGKTIE